VNRQIALPFDRPSDNRGFNPQGDDDRPAVLEGLQQQNELLSPPSPSSGRENALEFARAPQELVSAPTLFDFPVN